MQIIPLKRQNRLQGFAAAFPLILPISAHTIQKPTSRLYSPAPLWMAHRQALHPHRSQIPPPRRTLHRAGQPPIIIRYIRVQGCVPVMDPCQTVQHITDHASPARSAPTVCGSLASSAPGALAEGCSVSTCTGSARRLAVWHQVSSQGAPGQPGTLHPAGQSSSGRRGTIDGYRRFSFRAFARKPIEVSNSRSVPAGIVVANSRSFSRRIVVE